MCLWNLNLKNCWGTSLLVQWLRIHRQRRGHGFWSPAWEDSTCRRATKPAHHNYRAHTLDPPSHNYWSLCTLKPRLPNKRWHRNEMPLHHKEEQPPLNATREPVRSNKDPAWPKINNLKKKLSFYLALWRFYLSKKFTLLKLRVSKRYPFLM